MNITFLIGNGFDISCGMKSHYDDIYNAYADTQVSDKVLDKFHKEVKGWGDFEVSLAKKVGLFSNEETMVKCLRDFKTFMIEYLKSEEKACWGQLMDVDRYQATLQEFGKSVADFYKKNSKNVTNIMEKLIGNKEITYNFLSFNYTFLLSKLVYYACRNEQSWLGYYSKNKYIIEKEVIYIHGDLNNGNLTLGVDNEKQFSGMKFELSDNGRRAFIKPYFNLQYDEKKVRDAMDVLNESEIICTYGMSLGDSDLTWRKAIIDWLRMSSNHHLFIYDYNYVNESMYLADQQMDIEDCAKKELSERWFGGKEKKSDILQRIHIPIGSNIFDFQNNTRPEKIITENSIYGMYFME